MSLQYSNNTNSMAKKKGNKSQSTNRPKPVSGKGSYTTKDRRYGCGGKVKK